MGVPVLWVIFSKASTIFIVRGPGLPVPIILPSSLVRGADSAAVPVTKISSAV